MQRLMTAGLLIVLAGFALIFVGAAGQGSASAGGVVFVGPFPIVFGSGPGGWPLALLSVVIAGAMLALLFLWGKRFTKMEAD